jgi:hypothetical protein
MTFTGTPAAINTAITTVTYRGNLNFNTADTLTIATSDLGSTGSGGTLTDTDTVAITVNPINDHPVNTVPGALSVNEDTNLSITGLSVADVDLVSEPLSVTLSVSNGSLSMSTLTGISFATGSGAGSALMTFSGTQTNLNAALASLVYRANANTSGNDTLYITTSDLGTAGAGGTLIDIDSIAISVTPMNDLPVNTVPAAQAVNEDTNLTISGLSVADADGSPLTVTLAVTNVSFHSTEQPALRSPQAPEPATAR